MRMAEFAGKEIVNIFDGARLGVVGESDIAVDINTGYVESIILPRKPGLVNFWVDRQSLIIPWQSVKKIGAEVIIVELDQTNLDYRRFSI
ncbi:MAG: YlmC/YmxH family sporulation protein [Clostridiales bacterium]|nr:YlmC/YmxH family sporulation protein [Clostridiales bacterium]MCF8022194.1 YlmC/YmxH family sporulation protein [Clostridiales bacterium]